MLPGSPSRFKVHFHAKCTLSGAGVTVPSLNEDLPPDTGSLVNVGPSTGVSELDASTGNLFGHQDPGEEQNHRKKKKKASKGGTDGVVSVTVVAGSPAPSKRTRSGVYTPRELKKGK